jgi:hypothetical protein
MDARDFIDALSNYIKLTEKQQETIYNSNHFDLMGKDLVEAIMGPKTQSGYHYEINIDGTRYTFKDKGEVPYFAKPLEHEYNVLWNYQYIYHRSWNSLVKFILRKKLTPTMYESRHTYHQPELTPHEYMTRMRLRNLKQPEIEEELGLL